MSSHREQHYVPQFYLRNFSSDGRRVHLINIARKKLISGASIRHQCSRQKIYDYNPGVEEAFGLLEGNTARAMRLILSDAKLPRMYSEDHFTILAFIVLQRSRTMQAAAKNDAMTDALAKLVLEDNPELKDIDLSTFKIGNKFPLALPLSVASELVPHTLDLNMQLLLNSTREDFITSDAPIVLHNQFCEDIDYRDVCGWACSGLQVIWPLSPKATLFLYDRRVYKIGSRKGGSVKVISQVDDVEQLNDLQVLNAEDNVYFGDGTDGERLQRQVASLFPRRPKN